jgi:TonB-linked SusC/RagA family outer membrane protein
MRPTFPLKLLNKSNVCDNIFLFKNQCKVMQKNSNSFAILFGKGAFKYLLMTKLAIILSLIFSFPAVADSISAQTVSLNLKNVSIETAIKTIETQGVYRFVYKTETLPKDRSVTLFVENATLNHVMEKILHKTSLSYEIINGQLVVIVAPDAAQRSVAQIISGRVTDADGKPLAGVNISEKDTKNGTVSAADGSFSLNVHSSKAILVFSFVGYETREMQVPDKSFISLVLKENVQNMEDVIVVGYGQQKKASVVGSIVQVTGQDLERTGGLTNLGLALTGQLPGVTVVQSSGEPGREDPRIYIRSMGTWNNSQPLILVDGVERKMGDIDMSEVESVSVLKDASATSVFGVKGAQGVILITTKRGKIGRPVITFDANTTTKTISRVAKKLNSYDQYDFRNQAIEYQLNRAGTQDWDTYLPYRMLQYYKQPQANGLQYLFPDVDWEKELLKQLPMSYRANVNVSGGTDFAKYFGSVAFTFDDDMIKTDADPMDRGYKAQNSYERLNFRTNLDLNITKTTVFSTNLAGYIGNKRNASGLGSSDEKIFGAFAGFSPDMYPLLNYDGSYGYNPQLTNNPNPFARANSNGVRSNRETSISTDFRLTQKLDFITKGLSAGLLFSYDNIFRTTSDINDGNQSRSLYIDPAAIDILYSVNGSYIDENGHFYVKDGYRLEDYMQGYIFNQASDHDYDWSKGAPTYTAESSSGAVFRKVFYQAQVNYSRTFKRHEVGGLALFNREIFAEGNMFPRYREDWVGRVTYGYDRRYLFESNFAYNGSEKFSSKYRFGFFPSVAVGWVVTQEKFMQEVKWLNKLKLRYSLGKIGNDEFTSPRWAYQTNWAQGSDRTNFGYLNRATSPYVQYYESVVGNPNLRWETAQKQNLGIEITAFKNRIDVNLDLFSEHRTDIFMNAGRRTISSYFGQSAVSANLGETKGKGYELEATFRNKFGRYLNTFLTLTHTGAFDKIIYMEDAPLLPGYQKNAGYQINQVVTQIGAGYINNWDDVYSATGFSTGNTERMPGEYRILDFNGDGVIDASDAAPYSYPKDRPQHTYGFILGSEYKGFNVRVQFYGVYNVSGQYASGVYPFGNLSHTGPVLAEFADNSWTPGNTNAKYRSMVVFLPGAQSLGTYGYEDGSYLRLKTAEVGYALNKSSLKFLGVNSLRFFLNGNNLFLWSKMINDREGASAVASYPLVRRFNFGVSVKF